MKELQSVLNKNEKIVWQGQPNKVVYYLTTLFSFLFGAGIGVFIILVLIGSIAINFDLSGVPLYLLIGVAVLLGILGPLYRILVYPHILYVITDKRLVMQRGLIGRDYDFVDYDKFENATVNVGLLDKILGQNTGTIQIFANRLEQVSGSKGTVATRNVPFLLSHVTDPYGVFNMFKKTSFDVKADLNYPNELRPKKNKGYQTDYDAGA